MAMTLDDNPIYAASASAATLYNGDKCLGDVGYILTSLVGLEAFFWYVPKDLPTPREALAIREILDAEAAKGFRFWMVIEKEKPALSRWAKFMGFFPTGDYSTATTLYRRQEWA